MLPGTIPPSVLAILKHRWTEAEPSHSSFDAVFNGTAQEGRKTDPSYYHLRPGKALDNNTDVLTHAEGAGLVNEGVFGLAATVRAGGGMAINEHAQQAFTDFYNEVYAAWSKYRRKIAEVEASCPAAGG